MSRATNPLRDPLRYDAEGKTLVDPPEGKVNQDVRLQLLQKHLPEGLGGPTAYTRPETVKTEASTGSGPNKTHHVYPHLWGTPSKLTVTDKSGSSRGKSKMMSTSQETYGYEAPDPYEQDEDRSNFVQKGNFTEYLRESIRKHVNLKKTAH